MPEQPAMAEPEAPEETAAGGRGVPEGTHVADVVRLFREHNTTLVRLLATRLQSMAEAKEVAQEAYVRVLQLDQPGASNLLRAYLFRIALNLAVDRLRRRNVRQRVHASAPEFQEAAEDLCDPEREVIARDELLTVARCMKELPERCRKAFLMYRMDGEPQARIAQRLGVSERMVSMYIRQAMIYCRLRLEGLSAAEANARLPR